MALTFTAMLPTGEFKQLPYNAPTGWLVWSPAKQLFYAAKRPALPDSPLAWYVADVPANNA